MSDLFQELYRRSCAADQRCIVRLRGGLRQRPNRTHSTGVEAPFIRMGRSIRYRLDDVIAWLESLPVTVSTTEADAGKGHD